MDPYRQVALALAESLVIVAAVDGRIHTGEQTVMRQALAEVWLPGYGSQKAAMVGAFHEAKLARDFDIDPAKKMCRHAKLLSNVFSEREKALFMRRMMELIHADGDAGREEVRLYNLFDEHLKPPAGIVSSLKAAFGGLFGK